MTTQTAPRIIAIGRCAHDDAFTILRPPADWPTEAEIDAIIRRNERMDKFAAAIRALMDEEDFEAWTNEI